MASVGQILGRFINLCISVRFSVENPPRLVSPASKQAVVWGSTDAIVQQLTPASLGPWSSALRDGSQNKALKNCPLQRHDARLQLIAHRLGEVE